MSFVDEPSDNQPLVAALNDLDDVDWALRYLEEGVAIEVQAGFVKPTDPTGEPNSRLDLFSLFLDRVDRSRFEIVDLRPRRNWGPMRHVRPSEVCVARPREESDRGAK